MARLRRYQIQVENYTEARDGNSELVKTWALYKTLWASKSQSSGAEAMTEDRPAAMSPLRFEVRYREDLNESMRIKWNGKYYEIVSISDRWGLRKYIFIVCTLRPENYWNA